MRNLKLLTVLAVAIASTGCLRMTYALNLKPDGSGTIVQTLAMSKASVQQLTAVLGSALGLEGSPPAADASTAGSPFPKPEQLKAQAAALGDGVRFVSATPFPDGTFEGQTVTYAFDDVRKLKLNMATMLAGGMSGKTTGAPDPAADLAVTLTRAGDRSTLVLKMPKIPEPDAAQKAQAEEAIKKSGVDPASVPPEVEAMMKKMMEGLFIEAAINIDGSIVTTNAPFVQGTKITLLQFDWTEMAKSGRSMGDLMKMQPGGDIQQMLTRIPGMKVALLPEIRIEFR
ncbi:MAG: hypothetical protein WD690_13100 [Vicinamibacterales bacterium]